MRDDYQQININLLVLCELSDRGFDPPTFGLWAQRASSAPIR